MASKYRNFMTDVEADGQCPGFSNMTEFGVVCIEDPSKTFFSGLLQPIVKTTGWRGHTEKETREWLDPGVAMRRFEKWLHELTEGERPFMWSDNDGWDYQWINYYFHWSGLENPFGHTSSNLGSFYKGLVKNVRKNFKHLRVIPHNHDPVQDSAGNVNALRTLIKQYQIKGIASHLLEKESDKGKK